MAPKKKTVDSGAGLDLRALSPAQAIELENVAKVNGSRRIDPRKSIIKQAKKKATPALKKHQVKQLFERLSQDGKEAVEEAALELVVEEVVAEAVAMEALEAAAEEEVVREVMKEVLADLLAEIEPNESQVAAEEAIALAEVLEMISEPFLIDPSDILAATVLSYARLTPSQIEVVKMMATASDSSEEDFLGPLYSVDVVAKAFNDPDAATS